ncbi:MAG TPA: aminotransferase class I/II-fold pyridoxal phosphate-dependent enzyme [Pyrinomonadaceae bacterium]
MLWARRDAQARFCLASSGVKSLPLTELPVRVEELELNRDGTYGYGPLREALARKSGVDVEAVVTTEGTSMANHLAMAATVAPGDEVLIEHPTYELLVRLAEYLGAEVKRFKRREEDGFRVDPEELASTMSPRTRLIVLTNLHNPTSALTSDETLERLAEIARGVGAHILVDEVYLDALFDGAPRSAFHLGAEFITTGSLTKVYGLGGLRCGWILAQPALAQRVWRLNDLFGVNPAHPAERLSCLALRNLDSIAGRARSILEANTVLLNSFFESREELSWTAHRFGTVSFPRLKRGSVDDLVRLLSVKYETSVVPGKFFEMPQHFRIGIGCDSETLKEGLERLGLALEEVCR